MADKLSIEAQIAHFLRLAEDPGASQHERDLASERAEKLMIKHGIEETMLNREAGLPRTESIITKTIFFGGAYAVSRRNMAFSIIGALKLKGYYYHDVHGEDPLRRKVVKGDRFTLVGFESDVAEALILVNSLDVQAALASKVYARTVLSQYDYTPNEKTDRRRSFIESFGHGAAARIRETRRQVIQETEVEHAGTALVLVDREKAVAAHYEQFGVRSGRSGKARNSSAGYTAGYNANTGGRALGSTKAVSR